MEQDRQNEQLPQEKSHFFSTRFIRFLGGKNLLFLLIITLLAGCIIFIFDKISFIFQPFLVLLEVVILPGVLGVILYYLLRPFLRILMRWKVPRVWGILLIFLGLIGVITLLILLVVPFLKNQFTNLLHEFPIYFMSLIDSVISFINNSRINEYLATANIDYNLVLENITDDLTKTVKDTATNLASGVANGVTGVVTTLTGIVLSLVIVPFILFYLLWEGEKMPKFILRLFPPRMRAFVDDVMEDMDNQISSYIQGQILVSICIGIMVTIGFLIIKLPYALLLGTLAMVTSVVPYLGPVIAITPALIIAIVTSPFMVVKVGVVWTVVQLIEGKFISPQIMGKSLSIHPITIIFVLLTFGSLFGVPGVILGIPVYALIKVFVQHFYMLFKERYNKFQTNTADQYEDIQ
ncbi:AI-2E family transporter [Lysinibacillus sp. LZ02]|uniref:AI-2E family transporter n=1 Tax=Lysinibacillus sp. LZ02 TaxID=3420668 RepID=UPI003D36A97B